MFLNRLFIYKHAPVSVCADFSDGGLWSRVLAVPAIDLDPFGTYPAQRLPQLRGRRGSLQRTEPLLALSVDYDPISEVQHEGKSGLLLPTVVVEDSNGTDAADDIINGNDGGVQSLEVHQPRHKELSGMHCSVTMDTMPDVCVDAAVSTNNHLSSKPFQFKSSKSSSRSCFPITVKEKRHPRKDLHKNMVQTKSQTVHTNNNKKLDHKGAPQKSKKILKSVPCNHSDKQLDHNESVELMMEQQTNKVGTSREKNDVSKINCHCYLT